MNKSNLCDIWRVRNPDKKLFTWFRKGRGNNKRLASRIDMLLVSEAYSDSVGDCEIVCGHRTDHSMVYMDINVREFKRGPGAWKLNNKLLLMDKYVKLIKNIIQETIMNSPQLNPHDRWSLIKHECAIASKNFAKNLAKGRRGELFNLKQLENDLMEDMCRNPENKDVENSLCASMW